MLLYFFNVLHYPGICREAQILTKFVVALMNLVLLSTPKYVKGMGPPLGGTVGSNVDVDVINP